MLLVPCCPERDDLTRLLRELEIAPAPGGSTIGPNPHVPTRRSRADVGHLAREIFRSRLLDWPGAAPPRPPALNSEETQNSPRPEATPSASDGGAWSADLELVRQVRNGDSMATERFVQRMRCIPRMLSAMGKRSGGFVSAEEHHEVSQEVFSRVWSHLDRFEGRATLESWVYRYCSLTLMDARRARWKNDGDGLMERILAREEGGLSGPDQLRVQEAMAGLEDNVRQVVELKHFEDLSFDEVARRLEISPNTAKTRYYRGLSQLKQRLQRGFGGDLMQDSQLSQEGRG